MEFFKQNTKINFMKQRYLAYALSVILFVASLTSLMINHLNMGLDFTGGLQIELQYPNSVNPSQVKGQFHAAGFDEASVVRYGSSKQVQVTLSLKHFDQGEDATNKMLQSQVRKEVESIVPSDTAKITRVDYVGPQVGKQLAQQGVLAIIVSLIGTMIYIALRFEFRFAISAAIALIHDPILILGIFSFFHIEFNLIGLAAVLTVIGYSINDTVVVFDRVRENFRKLRKVPPADVMNVSINQTLSRTIMTSGLTLIVVIVLFIFGGAMLEGFSLALIIGIVIGTYSSIYVAGSLALAFGLKRDHLMPPKKQAIDSMP